MTALTRRTILAGAAATATASAFGPAFAMDPLKIGFVYVSPIGDAGWTYQHDLGRKAIEAEFGDKIKTSYVESVPEGADAERVLTQFALSGCNIVFTTSFGYMDPTNTVAAKFPNVKFEHATGYKREHANVSTYDARFYEGRAVVGHIAGKIGQQPGHVFAFGGAKAGHGFIQQ